MHNDNGKCAIEYLILASLGLCKSLNAVYSNIVVCEDRYFRVHRNTYIKGQPQSNPTSDVIVMAFSTQDVNKAINWIFSDSPRTPKLILADAEASSNVKKIQDKIQILQAAMNAYSVGGRWLLGLILAGNIMMLKAYILSEGEFEVYSPLHNKDLSEIRDLVHVMKVLNVFIHNHCSEMSEGFRSTLPIVRSRSSSVASTPSYYASGSEHGYSLQSHGPVSWK